MHEATADARPLRVMQVIPDLRLGGAERMAVDSSNGLAEVGHEVQLVAVVERGPQEARLRTDLGVRLLVLGIQRGSVAEPFVFLRSVRALNRSFEDALRDFRPDVVQTHIPENDLMLSRAVRRTGIGLHIPLVHSVNFHMPRERLDVRSRVRLRMYAHMLRRTSSVWAVSAAVACSVEKLTGYPARDMTVIHNGVDLRGYTALPNRADAKRALGIDPQTPLVLAVGRLHPAKNFPLLVRSSRAILAKHPNIRFGLVGAGPELARVKAEIQAQGAVGAWTLFGSRSDVPDLLAAADVFVQPSDWEGFPVSVIEAMAAGCAVVATDVAGVNEILRHEENGLLIPRGDERELAAAVLRLLGETETSARLASTAKEHVWSNYGLEEYVARVVAAMRAALKASSD